MKPNGQLVFVGAGNMAEALLKGILASGLLDPSHITLTDIRQDRLADLEKRYGVHTSTCNVSALANAGTVVLAVKPQQFPELLPELSPALSESTLVLSIAAGVSCDTIAKSLPVGTRILRAMPNTPSLVLKGAAGVACGDYATDADLEWGLALMRAVGFAEQVEEKELDVVTAVSGSGPAYVFYLMEAMIQAGEAEGLSPELARTLTLQTVAGAAELALDTGIEPAELRTRVTSKGGTTAAALRSFDEHGVKDAVVNGVRAAANRSRELSQH